MTTKSKKLTFVESTDGVKIKEEKNDTPKNQNAPNKKARIIVRNLPFKNLSEKKLKKWFTEYGEIDEVNLLKRQDGKFIGCGFVQFKKVADAAKAIYKANQREINGRTIIVDWAVPKEKYLESMKNIKQEIKEEPNDYDSVGQGILPYCIDRTPMTENDGNEDEESDEEPDSEDVEMEDVENCDSKTTNMKNDVVQRVPVKSNDVAEGKTIFIRNIPFSATNEDLKNCFVKFGAVQYALICIDKLTEHSKGSGFVKFKEKESVDHCMKEKNNILLEDNVLIVTPAVSKENLENMSKKKVGKDSRNLYLAKEGVVTAGSVAARGVSNADMMKRLQFEQWKSQMLKNLNMFISDRRLIIHNLPPTFNDKQLKDLFLRFSNPKAVVTEARVMREKKKVDGKTGLGVSKEYGFVTFNRHEDALSALRNINNNPKIFSIKKRPIVAFSIESKAALNVKQKRLEKSRAKLGIDGVKSENMKKLNRKQRRFIRRKEKYIEMRRQKKKKKSENVENKPE